jgi:hypothetical protein
MRRNCGAHRASVTPRPMRGLPIPCVDEFYMLERRINASVSIS